MHWTTSALVCLALGAAPAVAFAQRANENTKEDVAEYEASSESHLGITVTGLTHDLRGYFGVASDRGALVAHVAASSPAARAGLQVGDVVTAINGKAVMSADDVIDALSGMNRGQTFAIDVVRNKQPMTLHAELGRAPRAPQTR